jgi:transcriptional regulator with XRE-family HTH domain
MSNAETKIKYEVPPRPILQGRRKQVGMSQQEVADGIGMKLETVSGYEQGRFGKRTAKSSNTLLKMIDVIVQRAGEQRLPLDMRPHVVCPDDFDAPPTE